MENNLSLTGRNNILLYSSEQNPDSSNIENGVRGQLGNGLTKTIASARDASLFDPPEIASREKELNELLALRESDSYLSIDRKNKPVILSPIQTRIMFALSCALDTQDEEIKKKIRDPFKGGVTIKRPIDISALSTLLFGSSRFRERKKVIEELFNLSRIRQVQILGKEQNRIKITAPFINVGETIEDLNPERAKGIDYVNVIYGGAFFFELDKRFSIVSNRLFAVWRKKEYQTEMFSILLNSLLSVYWLFKSKADEAEARVKKELNITKKVSKEEYRQAIEEARQEALTYEINASSIKERLTRDYDSARQYRAIFWKDLASAVEGLIEIDLLTGYTPMKKSGAKGQDKVRFHFSDSYNFAEKKPLLPSASTPPDEEELSPF